MALEEPVLLLRSKNMVTLFNGHMPQVLKRLGITGVSFFTVLQVVLLRQELVPASASLFRFLVSESRVT